MTAPSRPAPVLERLDAVGMAAIAAEWDGLVAASAAPSPFLTSAWIGAWLETLGRGADLELITARDARDGSLLAAAPFHVEGRTRAGVRHRVLRFLGSGAAAPDHLDLLVAAHAPEETASAVWSAVTRRARWDLIDLDGVAADGTLARLLLRRVSDRDRAERTPTHFLRLAPTWEATLATFDGEVRSNLERHRRKLEREFPAAVAERMVAEPDDLEATMTCLERLHQARRTEAGQRGAFGTPGLAAFQREVARRMLASGRLRLWRLDVGADAIGVIESFRHGDTVSFYTTGFDKRWQRFGPGTRIMAVAVAAAIAEGATGFDFLRGDEPYKRRWGTEIRHDLRIIHPVSRLGRVLFAAREIRRRGIAV